MFAKVIIALATTAVIGALSVGTDAWARGGGSRGRAHGMSWGGKRTAIPGMTARPRLPTRAGIAIAIDENWRPLAPFVAAETAAHPRLSEL